MATHTAHYAHTRAPNGLNNPPAYVTTVAWRQWAVGLGLSASKTQIEPKSQAVKYKRGGKTHQQKSNRKPTAHRSNALHPIRQSRPALAQTNLNLPHDPTYGARAIVSAMGADYAHQLLASLNQYLQEQKEGAA